MRMLWYAPAEAMRNLPIGGNRDMVPEEMETNADGINTNSDAPAEVKGTLSLRMEVSFRGERESMERLTPLRLLHAQTRGSIN